MEEPLFEEESTEEQDIYSAEGISNYLEEDEISSIEESFMAGYLEA